MAIGRVSTYQFNKSFTSQVNNTQFPKERQKVCLKEPLKKRIKFGTVIPKSLKMNAINTIITQKNKDDFDNHQKIHLI